MHWRFFTKEGIKVVKTALQVPCCVSHQAALSSTGVEELGGSNLPPNHLSVCLQRPWKLTEKYMANSIFPSHSLSLHVGWNIVSTAKHFLQIWTAHWTWLFLTNLGRFKVWCYYSLEVSLTPDMLHGTCLLPESSFVPQWRMNFWKLYAKHIFSFNTFVKYAARKSELTLT